MEDRLLGTMTMAIKRNPEVGGGVGCWHAELKLVVNSYWLVHCRVVVVVVDGFVV